MEQRQNIIDSHRAIVLQIRQIEKEIEVKLAANDPHWRELEAKRSQLRRQLEPLVEQYWHWIPSVELSRCPYCKEILSRRFDKADLNGFWWMDRTQRSANEPKTCEHFCLLSGAINLNGLEVNGGLFECRPGPDRPFIIPRVLEMSSMLAVIGEIFMDCGYSAYPIAYFSKEHLPRGSLTQSWARKEYVFTLEDGRSGWDIKSEKQVFDLKPWISSKDIFIYREAEISLPKEDDPIFNIKGMGRNQRIFNNTLSFESFINT